MKRLLYLSVAALMALTVSCKKDDILQNSIILDNYIIDAADADIRVSEDDMESGRYSFLFDLSIPDTRRQLELMCSSSFDGKKIDLTKVIESEADHWWIDGYEDGKNIFSTSGSSSSENGFFQSGTLQIKKGKKGEGVIDFSIILKNGKTRGTKDGKDHTLEINFKGPAKLVENFQ